MNKTNFILACIVMILNAIVFFTIILFFAEKLIVPLTVLYLFSMTFPIYQGIKKLRAKGYKGNIFQLVKNNIKEL